VTPIRKGFARCFPADAIERIREKQLDVLIRFGFNILQGNILTAAKDGVWSYHDGDGDYYPGGPAHIGIRYEDNPKSAATFQVLPYWGSSAFVIQNLRELHQYGSEHIERTTVRSAPNLGNKKSVTMPSNSEMLAWLGPVLARKVLRRRSRSSCSRQSCRPERPELIR
jgi:hypothetical protein